MVLTSTIPSRWEDLEDLVTAILGECGMDAKRQVTLPLRRGTVDVDVLATETVDGIAQVTICECKHWKTNIPKEVVHAFRTVMQETGANRGYIISRMGFQSGAFEAAVATNITLVTFAEFQQRYLEKWYRNRLWAIERAICDFNIYYEPLGRPGYNLLQSDDERTTYDKVWYKYLYAGLILRRFAPYSGLRGKISFPALPFDVAKLEEQGVVIPEVVKSATGYRELLNILEAAASEGLVALRRVNPITRDEPPESIERHDWTSPNE
jgi:hypothetical protein